MLRNKRNEAIVALLLVAPFVAIYGLIFIYPTIRLLIISFQDAPLIGSGEFVGLDNYTRLWGDRRFNTAFWNTASFLACPTPAPSRNTRTTSGLTRSDCTPASQNA